MTNRLFTVPSTIDSLRTMKDQTIRLTVDCQELGSEEMALLFDLKGKLGQFLFKTGTITEQEIENIPDLPAVQEDTKSPSKRLYDRMFVYWMKKNNNNSTGFRTWYEDALDKVGRQYLDKVKEL